MVLFSNRKSFMIGCLHFAKKCQNIGHSCVDNKFLKKAKVTQKWVVKVTG